MKNLREFMSTYSSMKKGTSLTSKEIVNQFLPMFIGGEKLEDCISSVNDAILKLEKQKEFSEKMKLERSRLIAAYDKRDLNALLDAADNNLEILQNVIRDNEGAYHKIPKTSRGMKIKMKKLFTTV